MQQIVAFCLMLKPVTSVKVLKMTIYHVQALFRQSALTVIASRHWRTVTRKLRLKNVSRRKPGALFLNRRTPRSGTSPEAVWTRIWQIIWRRAAPITITASLEPVICLDALHLLKPEFGRQSTGYIAQVKFHYLYPPVDNLTSLLLEDNWFSLSHNLP